MFRTVRSILAIGLLIGLVGGVVATANAGSRQILTSTMAGIPTGGLVIDGVTGGGVPWVIDQGDAVLTGNGQLVVTVHHLVVASSHVNPISTGRAIVTCAGQPPITTGTVPFSPAGDATVIALIRLPLPCLAPTVFFAGVTPGGDRWFAVTGF